MPFGLKLRRTKRYNVLSKNYFVTRIRLLDNNVIECTLSVESTGQECLEAVAQRLELREKTFIQECSDSDRDTEILSSDSPASESTAVPDLKRTESVFRQYLQTETSLSLRIKTGMQSNNENLVSHLQCPKRQYLQTETSLSLRIKTGMQSNNENPVSLHCPKRKYLQTETSQSLRVSTGMQNNTESLCQIQGSKVLRNQKEENGPQKRSRQWKTNSWIGYPLAEFRTHYFGLWFHSKTQVPRWVELEKPLKKQLDKFGNEPLLFFGVMFYVPSVCRLEQEATRYQYYLQVKKEVLDGRLHCSVEQGIRLAGLAVQADFGDFTQYPSQDFLREYVLFPVNWPHVDEVLEDWTQKVAEEHKSHYRMQPAEAELLYIKEAEKLDGFGQESFAAKDNYTNDIFIGVSFIGVFVKHRNGRSIMLHRWKDIGTIGHNKSAITVEITSKDDTIMFHTEDMEMAKYIARLFTARHKFYKQNKICAEPTHSPVTIRRRPTWNRLPRPQSCILHSQYADHYQDTQSSQDSIFHDDPYYKSETSLVEFGFRNGPVPNGSMCSSPSVSSLNRSQTFIHSSPMSSNLSIPGSELMRPDYIPSHRHSAIIAPSYRPTPEYDAVMRQKRRLLPATPSSDCHSQSLRSLNISNTYAYRQPEALVYSQPEMRERGMYHGPYGGGGGPQPGYGPPTGPSPSHPGTGVIQPATSQSATAGNGISHTVSTPELANTKQQVVNGRTGDQSYAAHMLRNHLSRPPPPYPASFRPATSTPDLASSHRQLCMGGSSPELVTRKVQLSVKTFQPDSSAVVDLQSLQEVSEPLTSAKRRTALTKRHSMEVVGGMRAMEALVMKGANVVLPRRNTLREQAPSAATPPQPQVPPPPPPPPPPQPSQLSEVAVQMSNQKSEHQAQSSYQHQKTLSNVTMLIHSSESEEDEEEEETPELDVQIPGLNEDISAQLQAALANIPNKPPPEYPGPRSSGSSTALRHHNQVLT
ncbi:hypothetical protein MHYP_G00049890 [Metynnis hypsauchen]